jgi:hypothetical protein
VSATDAETIRKGIAALNRGDADGIADLERAVANFEKVSSDPGHLANAQFRLAQALWSRDHRRAQALLAQSLQTFDKASLGWMGQHFEASEWLASNGKPKRR